MDLQIQKIRKDFRQNDKRQFSDQPSNDCFLQRFRKENQLNSGNIATPMTTRYDRSSNVKKELANFKLIKDDDEKTDITFRKIEERKDKEMVDSFAST